MKKLGIILILSILLVSCSNSEPVGKYQAVEVAGDLIIINTITGEGDFFIFRRRAGKIVLIPESKISRPKK
jgi:hypothetical protein